MQTDENGDAVSALIGATAGDLTYYRPVLHRLRFRELWMNSPNLLTFIVLCAMKIFHIGLPIASGAALPHVKLLLIETEVPQVVRDKISAAIGECASVDLDNAVWLKSPTIGNVVAYQVIIPTTDDDVVIEGNVFQEFSSAGFVEKIKIAAVSVTVDGNLILTAKQKPDIDYPPQFHFQFANVATLPELLAIHRQRLAVNRSPAIRYHGMANVIETNLAYERFVSDWLLGRGVLRPLTPQQAERCKQFSAEVSSDERPAAFIPSSNSEADAIRYEILRLRQKRPGWLGAIVLLVVSIGLFVGLGGLVWDWTFVWIAIPVLLVHELGHFVAMKVFGYENVRMFFIPLFGAAVSGRNFNAPGWKRAVVSLMGPVPSIVLAILLGFVGLYFQIPALMPVVFLALVLNGVNLLPVLPLDGGWVVQTVLFSRSAIMEVAFRFMAACILLGFAWLARGGVIFILLGMGMLGSIPVSFKRQRIVKRLRRERIDLAADDNEVISEQLSARIAAEVRQEFPRQTNTRQLALLGLQVFDSLNARPPGWLASIGLLLLHLISFLAAIGFGVFFSIGPGMFWTGPRMEAKVPFSVESVREWGDASDVRANFTPNNVTLFQFADDQQAREQIGRLFTNATRSSYRAMVFGRMGAIETRPLTGEDIRPQIEGLRRIAKRSFDLGPECQILLAIECQGADPATAEQIVAGMNDDDAYLGAWTFIPPWSPVDAPDAAVLAIRAQFRALESELDSLTNDELTDIYENQLEQVELSDHKQWRELQKRILQIESKLRAERLAELQSAATDDQELALLELLAAKPLMDMAELEEENQSPESKKIQTDYDNWMARAGNLLGALPETDDQVNPFDSRFNLGVGATMTEAKIVLRVYWIKSPIDGIPAILRWLQKQGCRDFKYGVVVDGVTLF